MKRCPTCDRTFDDSMRFCQTDGTSLVDDAPIDPYKTMVARPGDIAASMPSSEPQAKEEDEVLQIPEQSDPLKTMYASEDEIRREMEKQASEDQVIEIPPLTEAPEPPKFSEPAPPPSPFATPASPFNSEPDDKFSKTSPPIPSPFGDPKPASFEPSTPVTPQFSEPDPVANEPAFNPFNEPQGDQQVAQAEWTPPAVDAGWQNQEVGQNAPFSPPAAAGEGQNKTLAIISLVTGILSLFCCGWFIPGIAAVVMGYLAKGKADANPSEYGGRGLAVGGMITGIISIILGVIVVILYLFTGILSGVMNM